MKNRRKFIFLFFVVMIFILSHSDSFAFQVKDTDNTVVEGKEGAFGSLNYWYSSFPNNNLFSDENVPAGNKKFFSGGVALNGGYQLKAARAEIILGLVGYDQQKSTIPISGSGILLGIRLRYRSLPVLEYFFSSGRSKESVPEPMGCKSISIQVYPKSISLLWPENVWFSRITIYPGLGIEQNWLKAGYKRDSSGFIVYDSTTSDKVALSNSDTVAAIFFTLKMEVDIYPQITFESDMKFGFNGNIRVYIGIKYLLWGPWMEKK